MKKEPEIVTILREEERLKKLQMKSVDSCEEIEISEDTTMDIPYDPIKLGILSNHIINNKKIEQEQLENEKLYQALFKSFPETLILVNKNGTVLDVNGQITTWLGYKQDEILGANIFSLQFLTKKSKKTIKKIFSNRISNKIIPSYEIEILTKNDQKKLGAIYTIPIRGEQSEITANLMIIFDITKQKHWKESMRIKESAINSSINAIVLTDLKGNITYVNNTFLRMWRYSKQKEVIGKTISDLWKIESKFFEIMNVLKSTGEWIGELTGIRKDNSTFQVQFFTNIIKNKSGKPICIMGCFVDITQQKTIWGELVKSEEKYRILAETSVDGVFTTDSLGRFTYVNPSFEKICGRQKNNILETPFRDYLLEDSIYLFQQIFIDAQKKNEKIENVELELISEDGNIIPIEVNIAPLKKEIEFSGIVCTVRDITQRRQIEDGLKKNERLQTEFMNIAAHELRSPITPIKGYLDLILHDNESNEKIKNWTKISLRNADRLLKLVNDILDVARLDSDTMRFNMEKINPVELLNEIVEDMKVIITNKKLEFRINIPTQLPYIMGDKNRLSQVLKNLIDNSIKFTDFGFIALEVKKTDNYLLISIEDTGIGISDGELKKVFTKFYQAYTGEDRNNEGTGLGLFISKEIVKKHKGIIFAESKIGKGSKFIIQLPYVHKMILQS